MPIAEDPQKPKLNDIGLPAANYTQIPNVAIERISELSGSAVKVFLVICRKTIGWHKISDSIPYSQIAKLTGLSIRRLQKTIKELMEIGWIERSGDSKKGYRYDLKIDNLSIDKMSIDKMSIDKMSTDLETKCPQIYGQNVPLKRKKERKKLESSAQPFITALFFEKYKSELGEDPPWTGKEGELLKKDIARLGKEKLEKLLLLFFDDPPRNVSKFATEAGYTYGVFHSQIPKLEVVVAEETDSEKEMRTCPWCGYRQEHTGLQCLKCQKPLSEGKENEAN